MSDREKELALKIILQTVTAGDFKEFSTHYKVLKNSLVEIQPILSKFNIDFTAGTYDSTLFYLIPGSTTDYLKSIDIATDMAENDYTVSIPK